MSKEFVLLQKDVTCKGILQPEIPENLNEITELKAAGVLSGITGFPAFPLGFGGIIWGAGVVANMAGVWNNIKPAANKIKFKKTENHAGTPLKFTVTAMERDDQTVDIAIKTYLTCTSAYQNETHLAKWDPTASLFQDNINYTIGPEDSSSLEINPSAISPSTNLKTVGYSYRVSWGANVGFDAGLNAKAPLKAEATNDLGASAGFRANANLSFSVSTSTSSTDFNLTKKSEPSVDQITWESKLQNVYDEGNGFKYNVNDPIGGLVINGAQTKWLKTPADAAMKDYDLQFLAGYSSINSQIKNKPIVFKFSVVQRLMHVEILHRWGVQEARIGGVPVAIPYYVITSGKLVIDLQKGTVSIEATTDGKNVKQIGKALEKEQNAGISNPPIATGVSDSGWKNAKLMAASSDYVYLVRDDLLYQLNASTLTWTGVSDSGWKNAKLMAASGDYVYLVRDDLLYQLNASTLTWTQVSDDGWKTATMMAASGDYVYLVRDDLLYQLNASTLTWTQVSDDGWKTATMIATLRDYTYLVRHGILYQLNVR
ncbi:MAG: hypothetical protein AAF572_06060 [Cyanobacteria bacterium P01_B01_bin.77]